MKHQRPLIGASASLASLSRDLVSKSTLPKIEVPSLSALLPEVNRLSATLSSSILPGLNRLIKAYHKDISQIAESIRKIAETSYPPNWKGDRVIQLPNNLETLLLDEGLPLAWVPSRQVLDKLFAATTPAERRKVLSNNWRGILNATIQELESIEEPELKDYLQFALESADSIKSKHWRASQALSTNLIDSILHQSFDSVSKRKLTDQSTRIDWKTYPLRPAIVFAGIWGSYSQYWPSNGDPIPRRYTRHASAHGVSKRQYSRLNALIALMHIVGLLKVLEEHVRDQQK
ncbi:hypothetical protein FJZ39_03325 [Candidatus Saccharibacteria bacterium]|nr:hypothetical protein [Candidatus Saccharibacteria bacterium]